MWADTNSGLGRGLERIWNMQILSAPLNYIDVTQEFDSQFTPWREELGASERWWEGLKPGDRRSSYPGREALKEDQEWNEEAGHDGVCFGLVELRSFSNIHVMTCSRGTKKSPSLERSQD